MLSAHSVSLILIIKLSLATTTTTIVVITLNGADEKRDWPINSSYKLMT
jgi:hypothetical protein